MPSSTQQQRPHSQPPFPRGRGLAQLSLIEHALCPLDARESLQPGFRFEPRYAYTDAHRNRRQARVRVATIDGLSAVDELYLWGLIGLALSQPEPSPDFQATPYWCLRQLGLIEPTKKGGYEFEHFRQGIRRLAGVRYENDAFYDPVRGEHRQVSFGFLNYSLPLDAVQTACGGSPRAWRFAWDAIFFELCQANRGALRFNLGLYRELSPAARRLYLFLKKIFWRNDHSPNLDIRQLGIHTLGFSGNLPTKEIKRKLLRCLTELLDHRIIQLAPHQPRLQDCFNKQEKGIHHIQIWRGPDFDATTGSMKRSLQDSPLFDPLAAIGFDLKTIGRILNQYPAKLIEQWADITLAAQEKKLIETSPPAYFQYYIQRAAKKETTPPDWWRTLQKQQRETEYRQQMAKVDLTSAPDDDGFDEYLQTEAKAAFQQVMSRLTAEFQSVGQNEPEARRHAEQHARIHLRNQFRRHRQGADGASKTFPLDP